MRLVLTILCLIPTLAISQSAVRTYEHREESDLTVHRIKLLDSAKFIKSFGSAFSHGMHLSKGHYTENNDTLTLYFEPCHRPNSWMEIIKKDTMQRSFGSNFKRIDKDLLSLDISVLDEHNVPTSSMVTLISQGVDMGSIVHAESRFYFTSENDVVTELELNSLGYKKSLIDLSEFRGTHAVIKVNLVSVESDTYRETFGEEKYLWRVRGKHLVQIKDDGALGKAYSLLSTD